MTQIINEHGKWRGEIRTFLGGLAAATRVCDTREQAERELIELVQWMEDGEE